MLDANPTVYQNSGIYNWRLKTTWSSQMRNSSTCIIHTYFSDLYSLPKVYKLSRPLPGRPVVSGDDNLLLWSLCRHTSDTVPRAQEIGVTPHTIFAILDEDSLLMNIQHKLGIAAALFENEGNLISATQ